MFSRYLLIAMVLFMTPATLSFAGDNDVFYYYFDEKIPLEVRKDKLLVGLYNNTSDISNIISSVGVNINDYKIVEEDLINNDGKSYIYSITINDGDITELIKKLSENRQVKYISHTYVSPFEKEVGVTPYIVLQFEEIVTEEEKQNLYEKYNLNMNKSTWFERLRIPDGGDVFDIANKIHESGLVKCSCPDFFNCIEFFDTWYDKQFALNNTGQEINDGESGISGADVDASSAWTITTGSSSIVVALIDDGVEAYGYDLPFLKLQILDGSNFGSGDEDDPSPQYGDLHGQACAGIIIAQHNDYGVRGIAPGCTLMPVRLGTTFDASQAASAINFAYQQNADIVSCSWGFNTAYQLVTTAINNAATYGRDGKGTIICFAAGNTADHESQIVGEVRYPARLCYNYNNILSVGASTKADSSSNYSPWYNYSWLSVSAPSSHYVGPYEVWTTDRAYGGYNPDGETFLPDIGYNYPAYTGRFGGTSASCPLVAGIAALVLSVDPTLNADEVVSIVCDTAEQKGGYYYGYDSGSKSNEMGHGRVNAYAAVVAAGGSPKITTSNEKTDTIEAAYSVTVSPLPANPSTTITYTLPVASSVILHVYSMSGQIVTTLVNDYRIAGTHAVVFDGALLASGIYLFRFRADRYTTTGKIVLVR